MRASGSASADGPFAGIAAEGRERLRALAPTGSS
jgi:hypothetical protein